MSEDRETFGMWLTRKRRAHKPKLSQQELAARAASYVPMSQTYVSLLERSAGTAGEPDISPQRIIALAHALGENPSEALALRAHVMPGEAIPDDIEIPLPGGGSIILRGRPGPAIGDSEKAQLAAVVDAMINVK